MDEKYIRDKITELRLAKGVSEYKMSLDLGHSKGYIQSISSGRSLPSMTEFLMICEYFNITPQEFFSGETNIIVSHELTNAISSLSGDDAIFVLELIKRIRKNEKDTCP